MVEIVQKAKRERITSFIGTGCALQAVGLLAPLILAGLLGVYGAVAGAVIFVILFLVGSSKAISWRCGNCRNPIAGKAVRICPVCRAQLD